MDAPPENFALDLFSAVQWGVNTTTISMKMTIHCDCGCSIETERQTTHFTCPDCGTHWAVTLTRLNDAPKTKDGTQAYRGP